MLRSDPFGLVAVVGYKQAGIIGGFRARHVSTAARRAIGAGSGQQRRLTGLQVGTAPLLQAGVLQRPAKEKPRCQGA